MHWRYQECHGTNIMAHKDKKMLCSLRNLRSI